MGRSFDETNPASFNPVTYDTCFHDSGQLGATREIICEQPTAGRYFTVYLYHDEPPYQPLHFCHLEVNGDPGTS